MADDGGGVLGPQALAHLRSADSHIGAPGELLVERMGFALPVIPAKLNRTHDFPVQAPGSYFFPAGEILTVGGVGPYALTIDPSNDGKRSWGITLSRDETKLFVANGFGDDITIIDTNVAQLAALQDRLDLRTVAGKIGRAHV
mgnify:CR=1 FL=1